MVRLVRAFSRHTKIIGLRLGKFGQLHANFFEVQAGNFVSFSAPTILP
jgi:hypothetical protein